MSKLQENLSVLETFTAQPAQRRDVVQSYMSSLVDQGLLEGVGAGASIDAKAREVLSALHHVLAGGEVHIDVTIPGAREDYTALERKCDDAGDAAGSTYQGPPIAVAAP